MAIRNTSVYSLFQQALRRSRARRGCKGTLITEDGVSACFALDCSAETIDAAAYQCSTCMTLVALCEYLRQWAPGQPLEAAVALRPEELLSLFPEIPPARQSRASLAVRAFHAAIPV